MKAYSIIQTWLTGLGLRHQGVLMTAVRGCDTIQREDPIKWLARFYRACVLNAHVGDPRKAATFMVWTDDDSVFWNHANDVIKSHDHYPHHYLMHLIHAAEILGYNHPKARVAGWWRDFYYIMCAKLHMNPETAEQLDKRLNADEETFKQLDQVAGVALEP